MALGAQGTPEGKAEAETGSILPSGGGASILGLPLFRRRRAAAGTAMGGDPDLAAGVNLPPLPAAEGLRKAAPRLSLG